MAVSSPFPLTERKRVGLEKKRLIAARRSSQPAPAKHLILSIPGKRRPAGLKFDEANGKNVTNDRLLRRRGARETQKCDFSAIEAARVTFSLCREPSFVRDLNIKFHVLSRGRF